MYFSTFNLFTQFVPAWLDISLLVAFNTDLLRESIITPVRSAAMASTATQFIMRCCIAWYTQVRSGIGSGSAGRWVVPHISHAACMAAGINTWLVASVALPILTWHSTAGMAGF